MQLEMTWFYYNARGGNVPCGSGRTNKNPVISPVASHVIVGGCCSKAEEGNVTGRGIAVG